MGHGWGVRGVRTLTHWLSSFGFKQIHSHGLKKGEESLMIVANSVATSLRTRNDSTGEQKEFFIHLMVIQKTIINLMFWVSFIVK